MSTGSNDLSQSERKVYERLMRSRMGEGFMTRSRLTHSLAYLGSASEIAEVAEGLVRRGLALSRPSRTGAMCYCLKPATAQFLEVTEITQVQAPSLPEGVRTCPLCHGDGYILSEKFEEFKKRVLGVDSPLEGEEVEISEGSISDLLKGGE